MCSGSWRMASERSDPQIPAGWIQKKKKKFHEILDAVSMQLHDDLSRMRELSKLQKSKLHDERLGLSPGYRLRLLHRNKVQLLTCASCGKEIELGDLIHVQHRKRASFVRSGGLKPLRVFHAACWEKLFIDS